MAGRDWDAGAYDRLSDPQFEWGLEVLERLAPRPGEVVLDAGCGSGRVTAELADRLPGGRVVAVDAAPSMVERAREVLGARATVSCVDLVDLELDEPVDAVFSNAVFHWVPDHRRLFARLYAVLRPGGRIVAQCGGEGNVAAVREAIRAVATCAPFSEHDSPPRDTWNFSSAETAAEALAGAGFEHVDTWLESRHVTPPEPREFLRVVTLGPHLTLLPADLRAPFVDAVAAELPEPLALDYVRLNLAALRPDL